MRVLLACTVLSATAQAANYRFGATQDRVVSDEAQGYTQHVTPDFEVQDGIGVTYVRLGRARVARLVSTDYAARVYSDVAPLDGADGKITAGDAWISQQATSGALSLSAAATAVERLLFSGARRILYESVPTTVYFAHDRLGSLTVETDDRGQVVGRRAFSTFGAERASSGDSDSYGFTGQRQDAGGTVHFSFRQLDPATGRWSSTDPLFQVTNPGNLGAFGEATTSYAYVANNPANGVDPTGLMERAQNANPQHANAQHPNAQHANGQHANAQHANAQHANAQHANAQHANAQHANNAVHVQPAPAAAPAAAAAAPAIRHPVAILRNLPPVLQAQVGFHLRNPHAVLDALGAHNLAHDLVQVELNRRAVAREQSLETLLYGSSASAEAEPTSSARLFTRRRNPQVSVLDMQLPRVDGDLSDFEE